LSISKSIRERLLADFYLREGATGDDTRFETELAVQAEHRMEKELHARSMCGR
jgi:hypothetical protein